MTHRKRPCCSLWLSAPRRSRPGAGTTSCLLLAVACLLPAWVAGAASESVLYSFPGGSAGRYPNGPLFDWAGTLFGTLDDGGINDRGHGQGILVAVTSDGSERNVHLFHGPPDGSWPGGRLTLWNQHLYGTTTGGGTGACGDTFPTGCGTIFRATARGAVVFYSFPGGRLGSGPSGALVRTNGAFFGTTQGGGASGNGVAYRLPQSGTKAGQETVLHAFSGHADGAVPQGLTYFDGVFYGTTSVGGCTAALCGTVNSACYSEGCGTVFRLTPDGHYTVLHRFAGNAKGDGALPSGRLIPVDGVLYGTTWFGGPYGYGTVFRITPSGTEKVIYAFSDGADGGYPNGDLVYWQGALYGTAVEGGSTPGISGCGTVFSITPAGALKTLYSFPGDSSGNRPGLRGCWPSGGVTVSGGTIYGSTFEGGAHNYGTVFAITP